MWVGDWPCVPFKPPYNPANFVSVDEAPRLPVVLFLFMEDASFQIFFELQAGVAQLAEHNVANVVVVGSNPITRSLGHEADFIFFSRPKVCSRKID